MISITIYRNKDERYMGFDCVGHAEYADAGEDIVCAGVSALVINTINSIGSFTKERFVTDTEEEEGKIIFRLDAPAGHDSGLLLQSMVLGLSGIMNQYGNEFLTLDFKEV